LNENWRWTVAHRYSMVRVTVRVERLL